MQDFPAILCKIEYLIDKETLIVSSASTSLLAQNVIDMKPSKLISILAAVACTLLPSCILLEPSPLFQSSELLYDDIDESYDVGYAYQEDVYDYEGSYYDHGLYYYDESYYYEDTRCSMCPCEHYQGSCRHANSVCVCGHSRILHSIRKIDSSLPGSTRPRFAVFVSAQDLIAAYKMAVDVAPNLDNPDAIQKNEVFINPLFIPAEGGSYEFEYTNEMFHIASVFDSTIPYDHTPFSTRLFKTVNSLSYNGPYYRVSCNMGKKTWKIEVDPMPMSDEFETRCIYVLIWTSSHNYNFVFHFEQSNL